MNWFVDPARANQLNMRIAPKPGKVIATLPAGTKITKLADHPTEPLWWHVQVTLSGSDVTGYVHKDYLSEGVFAVPPPMVAGVFPTADLRPNAGKKRSMAGGRAFPLDEAPMPTRPTKSANELLTIINWLKPDNATHMRYQRTSSNTFCNIYAYDYTQRCGVYMPRVWWTTNALLSIKDGVTPQVAYGTTVRELNANSLHDWFIDFGAGFGWRRVFEARVLQDAANSGKVAIIVAKRTNLSRSGHIVAVVPEHDDLVATGSSLRPVQSQAGSSNFTAKVTGTTWWTGSQFQSFGFWVCD